MSELGEPSSALSPVPVVQGTLRPIPLGLGREATILTVPFLTGKPHAGKMPEEQPPVVALGAARTRLCPPGTQEAHPGPTGSVTQAGSAPLGPKRPPLPPVSPHQPLPGLHPHWAPSDPTPHSAHPAAHPGCLQDRGLELLPRQPGPPRACGEWRPCQHQGPGAPMSLRSHTHSGSSPPEPHSGDRTCPAPRAAAEQHVLGCPRRAGSS